MTADVPTGPLEQSIPIDAVPADIFAVLTAVEPVFAACSGLTVSADEEGATVTDVRAEDASPSAFSGQVRVTEREVPTSLTMVFDGATEYSVAWSLQPKETSTRVTATVTNGLPAPERDEPTGGGKAKATGSSSSASESQLTVALDDVLGTLQTLCEQQPPPASMLNGELPEITSPFTAAMSPYLDEVTAHTRDWAQEIGLFQEEEPPLWFREVPRFTCRTYPHASFVDLCLCNDWISWGFVYDDHLDDTELGIQPVAMEAFQQPIIAVFDDTDAGQTDDPLVQGLADIWHRATEQMSPEWQDRFAQHHADFFAAQQWEAHNRSHNRVPPQETYIKKQRDAAAAAIPFALGELTEGIDLSSSMYNDDTLIALRKTAANIFVWTNDIYSLHKELENQEVNNLGIVVRKEQNCSLQEAVTEAGEMLNEEIHRFEEQSQQLTDGSGADPIPSVYQMVLERFVQGHLMWCQESVRYETDT